MQAGNSRQRQDERRKDQRGAVDEPDVGGIGHGAVNVQDQTRQGSGGASNRHHHAPAAERQEAKPEPAATEEGFHRGDTETTEFGYGEETGKTKSFDPFVSRSVEIENPDTP